MLEKVDLSFANQLRKNFATLKGTALKSSFDKCEENKETRKIEEIQIDEQIVVYELENEELQVVYDVTDEELDGEYKMINEEPVEYEMENEETIQEYEIANKEALENEEQMEEYEVCTPYDIVEVVTNDVMMRDLKTKMTLKRNIDIEKGVPKVSRNIKKSIKKEDHKIRDPKDIKNILITEEETQDDQERTHDDQENTHDDQENTHDDQERTHDDQERITCVLCGLLLRPKTIYRHMRRHDGEKPNQEMRACDVCGKQIKACSFGYHMQLHDTKRTFNCTKCAATFPRKDYLITHMKTTRLHDNLRNCEICNAVIPECGKSFKKHMAAHGIIDAPLAEERKTKKIKDNHNEISRKRNRCLRKECQYCGEIFLSRNVKSIIEHMNSLHHALLPYYCDWCDMRFEVYLDQRYHEDKAHPTEAAVARQPKNCEECGRPFARKYDHDRHMLVKHHDRKLCDYCPAFFADHKELEAHVYVTHGNIELYACNYCNQRFKCKVTLDKHIKRMHTEDTRCACNFCGKILKNKYSLVLHEHTHTGTKPHKCDLCDASFVQRNDYTQHRTCHFKKRPYVADPILGS